jgi:hypothetical protein
MTPRRARNDMIDASEAAEHIENTEATDPIEPIESADPTEPIDNTEPREPIDRSEFSDQSDHFEVPDRASTPRASVPGPGLAGRVHAGIPESSRAPRRFERSFDPVLWQWRPVSHAPPGGAEKPAAAQRQCRRDNGSRNPQVRGRQDAAAADLVRRVAARNRL